MPNHLFSPSDVPIVLSLAVPAYGLWGLSNDEGGVSGMVHTGSGEDYWMVCTGLLRSNS